MTPGFFGYSMLRASVQAEFYEALLKLCGDMRMPLEGLHTETGPGVLEAAITYSARAGSRRPRGAVQDLHESPGAAPRHDGDLHGQMVARLAGPVRPPAHLAAGQARQAGVPRRRASRNTISDEMRWFIGGQQALMPELLAMVAPTVNSYARLIPGFWAPTDATWGIENRTCALRAIPGSPKSQRVEYRVAAADINPYVALAAAIGSGLWGIEHKIEPDAPIEGNAYDAKHAGEAPACRARCGTRRSG